MQEPKEVDFSILSNWITNYLLHNKFTIGILLIVGVALGAVNYASQEPVYRTQLLATSTVISNFRIKKIFEPIDKKLRERDYEYVGSLFSISEESASKIKSLKVKVIEDKESYFDSKNNPRFESNVFELEVDLLDYNVCKDLSKGVKYFLDNNAYLKTEVNNWSVVLDDLIKSLELDLKLENKQMELKNANDGEGVLVAYEDNAGKLGMRKEIMANKKQLLSNVPVEIISEFVPYKLKINSLIKTVAIFVITFLVGGIFFKELFVFFVLKRKQS